MTGDPRWLRLLIRLANRVYFVIAPHLAGRPPFGAVNRWETRESRVRAVYGPSRRLVVFVVALWLLALLALCHLAVLALRGYTC